MPKFQVTDHQTGKQYVFDGPTAPTEADINAELHPSGLPSLPTLAFPHSSQEAMGNMMRMLSTPLLPQAEQDITNAAGKVPFLGKALKPAANFLTSGLSSPLGLATAGLSAATGLGAALARKEEPLLVRSALTREAENFGQIPRYTSEMDAAIPARRPSLTPPPAGPPAYMAASQTNYPIGVATRFQSKEPMPTATVLQPTPLVERRVEGPTNATRRFLHDLRKESGSEAAARQTGLTREQVKAATPEMPAGQLPTRAEQAYVTHPEYGAGVETPGTAVRKPFREDQRGVGTLPILRTLAGSTSGSLIGATQNEEHPMMGAAAGAALGAAAANPIAALKGLRDLRTTSLLSGYAPAKSFLGNIGAAVNASLLGGGTAPLTEMLRVPTNLRNASLAWQQRANPANISNLGRLNVFGRGMGALDTASQQALERAGLSTAQAQNLLLTEPNQAARALGLKNAVGEYFVPFQKTNFNQMKGIENIAGVNPNFSARRQQALSAAYALGGNRVGNATNDPATLGLAAAFGGPFGAPFLLGAATSAGAHAAESLTPIPGYQLGEAVRPDQAFRWVTEPGFTRLFK